ncbi:MULTISPECIES: glutamic-type intramembrane protease PrsW [unclassified Paenibacillus]|uniref:Protease PrsW n=1 Tax=Paenibacillus provencensis TaxID=441151 RepID=A0ABW3PRX3_9BACL|nr:MULTISPECIES: glutamic-type intramembrane protease PrsW [unclassified Paenibacillus]MCM3126533.1 glutamic-type intramembrane protease PrsW [Paenibacillus sp. MER 78]SFS59505.1 Membrane proteinase PrsW, cleaves anti-sigma factor RsiW, M82 family [Paenibacillus sp. 453mf]
MLLFSVLTAAIAPGLALLTYFYLKDRYDAEPLHIVIRMFFFGLLTVFPIMIIQRGLELWLGHNPYLHAGLISAGVEEGFKWLVMFHFIYHHTEFDEPYDGILYAVAISLGFATVENVLYSWAGNASFGLMLFRALLPVSGHAMFGVIMGYYTGRAKFSDSQKLRNKFLAMSLILPVFWHAIYDIVLNKGGGWYWFIVPIMVILWYGGMGKVYRANNRSPFRFVKREEEVNL